MLVYIFILSYITFLLIRVIVKIRIRKSWETVDGLIIHSTVKPLNNDTLDYVTFQFSYDGILYEIKETFGYENVPFQSPKVTVFVNPKDIYKSTIKPLDAINYLRNIMLAFLIFIGLFLYKMFVKK